MTIEFHCPHCNKLLKTPDDKAGVRANCPGCGQTVTVPNAAHEAAQADSSFVSGVAEPSSPEEEAVVEGAAGSPDDTKACPMCGATIRKAATRCRHCGETLVTGRGSTKWEPTRVEVGDILTVAWETYKTQLGILIGAFAIWMGITLGMYILAVIAPQVLALVVVGVGGAGGGGPGNALAAGLVFIVALVLLVPLMFGVITYMAGGVTSLWVRVARGESVEIADLYRGGRYFWRLAGVTLLYGAVGFAAYIVLLLPAVLFESPIAIAIAGIPLTILGIVAGLRLWPVMYFIVDRDDGVFDAFRDSFRATSGNSLPILLLALVATGVHILGVLACLIGVLFSGPFILLLFATAYCGMTGQLSMRRDPVVADT